MPSPTPLPDAPPETDWVLAWLGEGQGRSLDLPGLVEEVRRRQSRRGRPLGPGPARLPGLAESVGEACALLAALAALLGGTAQAAGTTERAATWVLARRPAGEWRFAGTCGALPAGTAAWIARNLSEVRFEQLECGAWTLDVPAEWLD